MSLGNRIKRALKHWGGGHRAFAREMQARGVRGGSYRSLVNYMDNAPTPSMKWIEEAATILEVSPDWLRTGEGSMEPQASREDSTVEDRWDVLELFRRCTREVPWFREQASDLIISSWWEATKSILQSCPIPDGEPDILPFRQWSLGVTMTPEAFAIGTWVCEQATGLAEILRPTDANWSRADFHGYFNLMFQALANAAPDMGHGKTPEELILAIDPQGAETRRHVRETLEAEEENTRRAMKKLLKNLKGGA